VTTAQNRGLEGVSVIIRTISVLLGVSKNDTDVTHYKFNPHQPISVIFGRDVAERVCYIEW